LRKEIDILTLIFFSWHLVQALDAFVLLTMVLIGPGPVGAGARSLLRWLAIFTLSEKVVGLKIVHYSRQ
jgi:hypothetical protein